VGSGPRGGRGRVAHGNDIRQRFHHTGLSRPRALTQNRLMPPPGVAIPPRRRAVVVAGATGLVGRSLIELMLAERSVGAVHALVRGPSTELAALNGVHPIVVDYSTGVPPLPPVDDAFCCLGTTIKTAGSQAAFRAVDFDAVLAFARAARAAGATRFGVVSALGANPKSGVFYNRVKGEMEAAIVQLGFDSVIIVRPSLLLGDRGALGQPTRTGEQLAAALTRPLGALMPKSVRPIEARTVARALLRAVQQAEAGAWRFESAALHALGREA
jgi:uncharacterized protein YbjT (DUF2867 family)